MGTFIKDYFNPIAIISLVLVFFFLFVGRSYSSEVEIKVTVACDEEWLAIYGDHWKQAALNAIEEADAELTSQFGINLSIEEGSFVTWKSNDWELNLADLLDQVARVKKIKPKDNILIAFTGQKADYVGMAYVNGRYCIIMHQNSYYDGIVARHEVSHLLGCEDENPPAKNIMSEWWDYPSIWGKECKAHIVKNKTQLGRQRSLSKGTPSVPQGPAITLQEEHDLREANKFKRFTEHMTSETKIGPEVTFKKLTVGKTNDFLTDLQVTLNFSNMTKEKIYVYDIIFNDLVVPSVIPQKRYLVDKKTDNFILQPNESRELVITVQLPWFQKPHPNKLRDATYLNFDIISSTKQINVDKFFIEAKKTPNYAGLAKDLRVLNHKKVYLHVK